MSNKSKFTVQNNKPRLVQRFGAAVVQTAKMLSKMAKAVWNKTQLKNKS